jgi:hypothetical protein
LTRKQYHIKYLVDIINRDNYSYRLTKLLTNASILLLKKELFSEYFLLKINATHKITL